MTTNQIDKAFVYGAGIQNDRIFVSTPATIYHTQSVANKSAVYAASDGSVWTDIVANSTAQKQRPVLHPKTTSDSVYDNKCYHTECMQRKCK